MGAKSTMFEDKICAVDFCEGAAVASLAQQNFCLSHFIDLCYENLQRIDPRSQEHGRMPLGSAVAAGVRRRVLAPDSGSGFALRDYRQSAARPIAGHSFVGRRTLSIIPRSIARFRGFPLGKTRPRSHPPGCPPFLGFRGVGAAFVSTYAPNRCSHHDGRIDKC